MRSFSIPFVIHYNDQQSIKNLTIKIIQFHHKTPKSLPLKALHPEKTASSHAPPKPLYQSNLNHSINPLLPAIQKHTIHLVHSAFLPSLWYIQTSLLTQSIRVHASYDGGSGVCQTDLSEDAFLLCSETGCFCKHNSGSGWWRKKVHTSHAWCGGYYQPMEWSWFSGLRGLFCYVLVEVYYCIMLDWEVALRECEKFFFFAMACYKGWGWICDSCYWKVIKWNQRKSLSNKHSKDLKLQLNNQFLILKYF